MAFLVMFVTPVFAHGIDCTPDDSIVWSSRSVTTAIGIVIGKVLGANQSIVTCIIVFTGIMGPLCGTLLFKLARVRDGKKKKCNLSLALTYHFILLCIR
jgi:putative effector of murein hydrolase